jgi:solute carrier family 13 (sodium-dependent dicarboxylate transporter), member 2/3/5
MSDLFESEGALSPAEERFEKYRQRSGFILAPLLFVFVLMWPMPELSQAAHRLAAIAAFTATLWITEVIPMPAAALLGPALCVLFGVAPVKTVFAPFADPVVFLFIGSFIIAQAMFTHGLDRRIAVSVLSSKWVGPRPGRILFAFAAVTLFVSMWLSNTATTAMMYPIGLSLIAALSKSDPSDKGKSVRPYAISMLLLCAYASSLGGLGTPVGTPPNLIGLGMIQSATSVRISFFHWMLITAPAILLLFAFLMLTTGRSWSKKSLHLEHFHDWIHLEKKRLGVMSRGEKNTTIVFGVIVALWIIPGITGFILGSESTMAVFLNEHLPESVAALVGTMLLFLLPVEWSKRTFTMNWREAAKIDWGTILLFGGGLSLGTLMFSTGLAETAGRAVQEWTGARSVPAMTFLFTGVGILLSEFSSNTAAANVLIPIAIGMAKASGVNPLLPALGACLGVSMGFMFPVSTPPNAIVYGSGMIPITRMIRYGIIMDLAAAVIMPLVILWWAPFVLPELGLAP